MIGLAPPQYDPAAPASAATLPVGTTATVRDYVRGLLRRHRRAFRVLVTVNAVAVIASMVGPYLLGRVVDQLAAGARELHLGRVALLFALALVVQTFFVRLVRLRGAMLGEEMLADLREDFLVRSVGLPPGVLERAAPVICCRGSPPTSTGWPTRCARPFRSWRPAWSGSLCSSGRSR